MAQNKADENKSFKTVLQKMTEVAPYYIAKYVEWYLTDPEDRIPWDDLCNCNDNYRLKTGGNKTEQFAKDNWLTREDTQRCIQIYMKHMKTINTMKIYEKMLDKALQGDVNAAKYIEGFHNSDFFNEDEDEINDFLNTVNIPKLKKTRG
ncbi:hypothetical protein [Lacrimispora brassicae]